MQLYEVTEVIDGDTFIVTPPIFRNSVLQSPMQRLRGDTLAETPMQQLENPDILRKVRLANLNAEESGTPKGIQATLYLKELIEGKRVTLKPLEISFDRVVAEVWRYPNKVYINAMMVYSGYATWVEKTSIE